MSNGLEEITTRFSPLAGPYGETFSWNARNYDLAIYYEQNSKILQVLDLVGFGEDLDNPNTTSDMDHPWEMYYAFGALDEGFSIEQTKHICGWYWSYNKETLRVAGFAPKICDAAA